MQATGEDRIRELFISREAGEEGRGCPPSDRIWAAVSGQLSPEEVGGLVDHTAACAHCAESWRLAAALAPPVSGHPAATSSARGRPARRSFALAGLAAALALFAIGLPLLRDGNQAAPVYRGADSERLSSTLAERARLPRDAFDLGVDGGEEGTVYHFVVTTIAGDEVFEAEQLETPVCRVPAAALAGLPDGVELAWYASGVTPAGEHLETALQIVILGPSR